MEQTFKRATWEQLAKGITGQFGESCEVVIHDLTQDMDHTIVYIENGHVTGRKVGDGSSKIVIETLNRPSEAMMAGDPPHGCMRAISSSSSSILTTWSSSPEDRHQLKAFYIRAQQNFLPG